MRPVVLYSRPSVDCGLRGGQVRERDRVIEQLAAQAPWNRSIFPVVVGDRGWVSRWAMPLSRQIRSNSTSPPLPNRSVNCLPLSVRTSPGPRTGAAPQRTPGRPPGRWPGPPPRRSRSTGNGHRPRSRPWPQSPVGQERPADDVHLPQRHRLIPLPPQVAVLRPLPACRLDQPVPDQDPVDAHPRRRRPHPGLPQPMRQLVTSRSGPHLGCSRRISHTAASTCADV